MKKIFITTFLSLACANAGAVNWPGQATNPGQSWDYCMGLVLGGLDSNKVGGMSRSELWQAWSFLIRSGALEQISPTDDYKAGLARFGEATDADSAETILEDVMGECGIGRTGHQITGW